jgi:hypothetical protein
LKYKPIANQSKHNPPAAQTSADKHDASADSSQRPCASAGLLDGVVLSKKFNQTNGGCDPKDT